MTLLYSMSSDQDDQREEAASFLANSWSDVLEESPALELRKALSSSSWTAESFEVQEVELGDDVRIRFVFDAKGLDAKSKGSGDRIHGSAVAVVDEYDRVRFIDVEVE
jgi:hypothetical protein